MRAIIILLTFCTLANPVIAQRSSFLNRNCSLQQAREYILNNISYLDDIEGIYDCSIIPTYSGGNLLFGLREWGGHEYDATAYISKQSDGNYYCKMFCDYKLGLPTIFEVIPLGNTNAYRLSGPYNEKYSHFGNSGILSFQISTRFVLEKGSFHVEFSGNDEFHMVSMAISMIKTYPTIKELEATVPKEWTGTGFALKNGYIVTNFHVVDGAKIIKVQGINGEYETSYNAIIVSTDKYNDLAIIKIADSRFKGFYAIPYCVKTTQAEVGEDIFVLGYPLTATMGNEIKLTTGVISSGTGFQGDASLYQISAPIQPGNSGGPLFDKNGNLIGIVSAKLRDAENVGYAIKSSYLSNLIKSSISTSISPTDNKISSLSLTNKVKTLRNFIFKISCTSSEYSNEITLRNTMETPLFQEGSVQSPIVAYLPPFSTITIIERDNNTIFMKVRYKDYEGYISKKWLNVK